MRGFKRLKSLIKVFCPGASFEKEERSVQWITQRAQSIPILSLSSLFFFPPLLSVEQNLTLFVFLNQAPNFFFFLRKYPSPNLQFAIDLARLANQSSFCPEMSVSFFSALKLQGHTDTSSFWCGYWGLKSVPRACTAYITPTKSCSQI